MPRRPVTYCLVPAELGHKVHEMLRKHFAAERGVEVVVEMRRKERRGGKERRREDAEPPGETERRLPRALGDRRSEERRARQVAADPLELPRGARRHAEEIRFVRALEPSALKAEDRDTARLVARFQAGDDEAFAGLYRRYFERVFSYLKVAFKDSHDAEDVAQDVFMSVFEHIDSYERRGQPFRSWLFRIARNAAISHLRRAGRVEPTDPAVLNERLADEPAPELDAILTWITDRDLAILVERLPLAQRQALLLHYGVGLNSTEAARVLGRKPSDVRMLQHRALEYLRDRLGALRSTPASGTKEQREQRRKDSSALRPVKRADVMRARRYVLK